MSYIGKGANYPFGGNINSLRIWNRALSMNEVRRLADNPYAGIEINAKRRIIARQVRILVPPNLIMSQAASRSSVY